MTVDSDSPLKVPPWRLWVVQFDVSHNAMALGFFAYTSLCKTAHILFNLSFLHWLSFILFYISCLILLLAVTITATRILIFPAAFKMDFSHPRLVSFFFLPVLISSLLLMSAPSFLQSRALYITVFYIFASYQVGLAWKLCGKWLYGSSLPSAIYPLYFMQTVGFFMLSSIASLAHLNEQAIALLSIGTLLWLLVLMTNFQHVAQSLHDGSEKPQPTFFLFIAPPAQAAIAAALLSAGDKASDTSVLFSASEPLVWSIAAKAFLYVDIFLYGLMFRLLPTFWNCDFSFAWWAYVFPLSAAACASIWRYNEEKELFWAVIGGFFAVIATCAMVLVLMLTIWGLASEKVPQNKACKNAYAEYYARRHEVRNFVQP